MSFSLYIIYPTKCFMNNSSKLQPSNIYGRSQKSLRFWTLFVFMDSPSCNREWIFFGGNMATSNSKESHVTPIYVITDVYIPTLDGRNSTFHHAGNTSVLLNLQFSNPNKKMGIFYNNINITLYYRHAVIGSHHSLPAFYQGYKNTTVY